jgi:uncharacterized protein
MPTSPPIPTPGVYITEIPSGVHAITGVSTSVTAFIGTAQRGPINTLADMFSFADYERQFGGLAESSEMSFGVRQFFNNGGSHAIVVRVGANAQTASLTINDGSSNPSLVFTALDGGASGNGTAVAVDYPTDPNRFNLTLTGVPDANGNSAVEQFSGLSMNSTDRKFVESATASSGLVSVKRSSAAVYGSGSSTANPSSWPDLDATHNTVRVAVDGKPAVSVSFTLHAKQTDVVAALTAAVVGAKATNPSANKIVITSNFTGDTSSVVVFPGLTNDAAKLLGFGVANGGIEVDGSAVARPAPSPDPGMLVDDVSSLNVNKPPDGNIALTLDNGRPVIIPLHVNDVTTNDWNTFAARIQSAVQGFRPTVQAFANFAATYDGTKLLTLASGTRGPNSAVYVTDSPPGTLATTLGLVGSAASYKSGSSQVLSGGSEDPLSSSNTYATFVPPPSTKGGIYALENVDIFNIICLPGITDASTLADTAAYCEERNAFLIVDPPTGLKPPGVEALLNGTALPKSDHAAIYYPNIYIGDPITGGTRLSAPSGTLAGLYARTDGTRGVWKAPAGTAVALVGAQQLEYTMTDGENGLINPLGGNAIRNRPPYGIIAWGARTLNGSDAAASEYKYISIRRLASYIELSLMQGTQWVVFEPNDEPLWSSIRLNVGSFMNQLFRQGAFEGQAPADAYFVRCDSTTTTEADRNNGVVNILVGFAPLKPAEFVLIQIQQMAGQIAT